jgi:superoxide dismutase
MIDYKTDRAKYLEAFINNMNWDVVEKRLNVATKHPSGADSTL